VAGHHLSQNTAHRVVATAFSDSLLFQIVHVEPVIHDAVTRDVSMDVVFHEFLELVRQIAQSRSRSLCTARDQRTEIAAKFSQR